ncbi:uncharacterized protein LOC127751959 [Frankliniella occidentalis]|uniref:Uncharacterized protein LOC127751959 n=1 Tax=Frankliniella occidentalis TaxID=133901 RepID=A0A9C6XAZ5_FRAOC|nr:uncharacterized protein LOC127751959 [Frankliniella occidentalis]XP_052132265.1 uncharacterized protein LOC127751959 [Frankliniella occidentalis]
MDVPVLAGAAASAMASVPGGAPLLFYRLQPYSALTPCLKQLRPLKVGAWRRGEGFVGNTTLFPSGELWHFQNCPLKVAVRLYPPFADLKRLKIPSAEGDVWEFRGQFTPLLRALEYGMHAHFNLSPMPDTGKPEAPVRSNFDLYLTRTLPDPEHRSEVPTTGRSGCYTVCVPRRWRQTPLWRALLAEFSAPVWALVIATFITMRLALTPILDERDRRRGVRARHDVGFLLLAGVLGSVQASTPGYKPTRAASNRERSLFVMWLFFSLVMSTAYQAVQHSLRTAPQIVDSLRDLEVLAHSDVIINGPQVAMAALSQAPGGAMLLKRYRTYNFSGITTMKLSLDEAYMCSAFERFFLERKLGRDEAGRPFHVPVDNCMVSFAEAFIALPVGSFYLHKASEVILRMTETGITQHVIGRRTGDSVLLMKASDTAPGGPQREDLVQLSPALLLLGVGLGLAAAAFLLELAVASGACGRPGWWPCAARPVAAVRREDPAGQPIAAAPPFKDELWPRRRLAAAGNDHSATITADSWTLFLP